MTAAATNPALQAVDPPLAAILRGLTPSEAPVVGRVLLDAGFRILEVPLNRPAALECIAVLAALAPPDALVGGGTMLERGDVDAVQRAGGRLMVAPHCDPVVIAHARAQGMTCLPGIATPTEAYIALRAGAHALKIFPAEMVGAGGLKAIASILPPGTPLWPVGGITPDSIAGWRRAGAGGFGIGGQLFQPGMPPEELAASARRFVAAWRAIPA